MTCQFVVVKRVVLALSLLLLPATILRPAHAQLPVGRQAPLNFSLLSMPNGNSVNVGSATRGRPLLLNFWSAT